MIRPISITLSVILFIALSLQAANAYEIPQRRIDVKPYLSVLIPNGLFESNDHGSPVEDDPGVGIGVKVRTQVRGSWGFVVNASITDLTVDDNLLSTATIFTGGFYYSRATALGRATFDLGYGLLSVADHSAALLLPALEISRSVSDRLSLSLEVGMPIANDWFHDFNVKENYNSFSLSLGGTILF